MNEIALLTQGSENPGGRPARGIRESRSGTTESRQVVKRAARLAEPLLSEKINLSPELHRDSDVAEADR